MINSELVVQTYPEFKKAEEQLGLEMQSWETERGSWEADMERLKLYISEREEVLRTGLKITIADREEVLRTGQAALSDELKTSIQAEIDSLRQDYDTRLNYQITFEQERFNKRRAELLAGVFEIVNESIEELGEQNGYDFIIDSANGTVVYAKEPDDLNDQLLRILQDK